MPTYQYACKSCGHRFDIVQSFSDPSLTECPECGGVLRKVFNSVGVVFKGSGFYRTDSRSGSTSDLASKPQQSGSTDSSSSTSSDSSASTGDRKSTTSTTASTSAPS